MLINAHNHTPIKKQAHTNTNTHVQQQNKPRTHTQAHSYKDAHEINYVSRTHLGTVAHQQAQIYAQDLTDRGTKTSLPGNDSNGIIRKF